MIRRALAGDQLPGPPRVRRPRSPLTDPRSERSSSPLGPQRGPTLPHGWGHTHARPFPAYDVGGGPKVSSRSSA